MEISEVKEETEDDLNYAMEKLLGFLKNSKIVVERLKEDLKKPNIIPEASLQNITKYFKNIEAISQVCDNETEIIQCK